MFVRFDFEKRKWVNEVTCVDCNDVKTAKDTVKIKHYKNPNSIYCWKQVKVKVHKYIEIVGFNLVEQKNNIEI